MLIPIIPFEHYPHDEAAQDEILLTNIPKEFFIHIKERTKRLGRIAYDVYGQIIEGYYPVFVKRWEMEKVKKDGCYILVEIPRKEKK